MRNKLLTLLALVITSYSSLSGQMHEELPIIHLKDSQRVEGKAYYSFVWQRDSNSHEQDDHEIMILKFSKETSEFSSYSYYTNDSAARINRERSWNEPGFTYQSKYIEGIREKYYTQKDNTYEIRSFGEIFYLIPDKETVQWTIEDSVKQLQGYIAQKATASSHGRNYTVWFTSDLPYSFGPRRLHGLPGLILEAYDNKGQIRYSLNKIDLQPTLEYIGIPVKSQKATLNQFLNMADAWKRNYKNGSIKIDGKEFEVNNFSTSRPVKVAKSKYNNPIDLQ
ncbi:MAG: hypothetical protein DI598_04905 [Pseudopedobacter saltans]|uniref:GLPGLI family protein n=1 Tax=Pseudopedobacter saltans TaxID=151895 RepID=A0A2W5FAG0_9SPHI|nr:MAG: hypothetical protein DI598_04905 [Pseudopedobacter saltans]